MEDDLNFFKNERRPQFFQNWKTNSIFSTKKKTCSVQAGAHTMLRPNYEDQTIRPKNGRSAQYPITQNHRLGKWPYVSSVSCNYYIYTIYLMFRKCQIYSCYWTLAHSFLLAEDPVGYFRGWNFAYHWQRPKCFG